MRSLSQAEVRRECTSTRDLASSTIHQSAAPKMLNSSPKSRVHRTYRASTIGSPVPQLGSAIICPYSQLLFRNSHRTAGNIATYKDASTNDCFRNMLLLLPCLLQPANRQLCGVGLAGLREMYSCAWRMAEQATLECHRFLA